MPHSFYHCCCMDGWMDVERSSSVDQVHCQWGYRWTMWWVERQSDGRKLGSVIITSYVREQRGERDCRWLSQQSYLHHHRPPCSPVCVSITPGLHLTVKSPTQHNNTETPSERGGNKSASEVWWRLNVERSTVERHWNRLQRERRESVLLFQCVCSGDEVITDLSEDIWVCVCVWWRWEMGAAMCKLSDKVGQHVKKRSTGRIMGANTHSDTHTLFMQVCVFVNRKWAQKLPLRVNKIVNGAAGVWPNFTLCVCVNKMFYQ